MIESLLDSAVTLLAFAVALSILIVVHEYGHYRMAVACGVKVLRFSLGFGKPIYTWKKGADQTEFAIAPFPFGGYVRMLDGREGDVAPKEAHRAFNNKPLPSRALIVAAGPVANFILAIVLTALTAMFGMQHFAAKLAQPVQGSMFEQAGVHAEDVVIGASIGAKRAIDLVPSFNELWELLYYATASEQDVNLRLQSSDGSIHESFLPLSSLGAAKADKNLMQRIGFNGLWIKPVLQTIIPDGAAQRAGLQAGDVVKTIDGKPVYEGRQLFQLIQALKVNTSSVWEIEREGQMLQVQLVPDRVEIPVIGALAPDNAAYQAGFREGDIVIAIDEQAILERSELMSLIEQAQQTVGKQPALKTWLVKRDGLEVNVPFALSAVNIMGQWISKIDASIATPEMVTVQYGLFKSFGYGASRTWFLTRSILTSITNMIVGKSKVQDNLSGPVEIAKQAGKSARGGLLRYTTLLVMLSISLGVLNLLPLPVLDGGHLLLYMIEAVRGKPLSDLWMEYIQRTGIFILLALMLFVTFNDVLRLIMS